MTGSTHDVSDDWFVWAVERVSEAAGQACEAIQVAVRALESGGEARAAGASMAEVVDMLIGRGGEPCASAPRMRFVTSSVLWQ